MKAQPAKSFSSAVMGAPVHALLSLPRPPVKDPKVWEASFMPPSQGPLSAAGPITNEELKKEICKYGDLCQITYDNFINNETTLKTLWKNDRQRCEKRAESVLGPYKVGNFIYEPNEVMQLPPGMQPSQLDVAEGAPARRYAIGVPDEAGNVECDPTFYLIATSGLYRGELPVVLVDDVSTNWIGYIAIGPKDGTDKRDIAVAFRGTQVGTEWASDATFSMTRWEGAKTTALRDKTRTLRARLARILFGSRANRNAAPAVKGTKTTPASVSEVVSRVRVAEGFQLMYRSFSQTPGNTLSLQGQVHVAVRKLLARFGKEVGSITVTGHSLGGALAQLCAFDIAASGINHLCDNHQGPLVPVTAVTFESPRVGNTAFRDFFDPVVTPDGPRHLRINNVPDVVPKVPYIAWSEDGFFGLPLALVLLFGTYVSELFGKRAGEEHDFSRLGFHHAGTEYRLNDSQTLGIQGPGNAPPTVASTKPNFLVRFARATLLPLFPASIADLNLWHNHQHILAQLDPVTRGFWGPLGVPNNKC
ncbi:hypothetical protein WJX81_003660 [Elliptochloris bilobata]|uniref:Fungal lipase-type domain-containing protein n=1 Tax=Elliptochloris bilobata TaxID=381761 RepID=A0AAW1S832_9CHLO